MKKGFWGWMLLSIVLVVMPIQGYAQPMVSIEEAINFPVTVVKIADVSASPGSRMAIDRFRLKSFLIGGLPAPEDTLVMTFYEKTDYGCWRREFGTNILTTTNVPLVLYNYVNGGSNSVQIFAFVPGTYSGDSFRAEVEIVWHDVPMPYESFLGGEPAPVVYSTDRLGVSGKF